MERPPGWDGKEDEGVRNAIRTAKILAALAMLTLGLMVAKRLTMDEAECQPADHAWVRVGAAVYRIPAGFEPVLAGRTTDAAVVREDPPRRGGMRHPMARIIYCRQEKPVPVTSVSIHASALRAISESVNGGPDLEPLRMTYVTLEAFSPAAPDPRIAEAPRISPSMQWRRLAEPGLDIAYRCRRNSLPDDEDLTCQTEQMLEQRSVRLGASMHLAKRNEALVRAAALALDRMAAEWRVAE